MWFNYVAYNLSNGVVKGRIDASSEYEVRAFISQQGLKLLRLFPVRRIPGIEAMFPSLFRPSTGVLIQFLRQLATLLTSGANLLRALEMIELQVRNKAMKAALEGMRRDLDGGKSLSEAMSAQAHIFPTLFVSIVEVGETTGRLSLSLEQMAEILEREQEAKQKAIHAMMYPAAIVGMSVVTVVVLMTVALPPLLTMFDKGGTELPLITRIVMAVFGTVRERFIDFVMAAAGVGLLFAVANRVERTKHWLELGKLRLPLIGPLIVASEIARMARTVAMLLTAGVPLVVGIRLAKNGSKNLILREALEDAEESLLAGQRLLDSLRRSPVVPALFVELIAIGEESNALQRAMGDAANAYQEQLDARLNALIGAIEPLSTVIVGGIVGVIAFSMFLPIYSALESI